MVRHRIKTTHLSDLPATKYVYFIRRIVKDDVEHH